MHMLLNTHIQLVYTRNSYIYIYIYIYIYMQHTYKRVCTYTYVTHTQQHDDTYTQHSNMQFAHMHIIKDRKFISDTYNNI